MNDYNQALVIATARSYNSVFSKIEKHIQKFDLSLSEFGVLEMLLNTGEQSVQKIAEKILVTSGTITYVLDKLQRKGLISRKKCEKDKRVFYITLTSNGETFISEVFMEHTRFLEALFQDLDRNQKKETVSNLLSLIEAVSEKE